MPAVSPLPGPLPDDATRHATLVRWQGRGLLIEGPSGSGKSDLALRLVADGGALVADDVVRLWRRDRALVGGPVGEAGLIEVRGYGVYRLPAPAALAESGVDVRIGLETGGRFERLPEAETLTILGVDLPCWRLDPRPASTVARLRVLVACARVA
ncbi:MAG: HPr kinase/phosphatase C-terminal domain-containing protein [Geminicoccaceae bacterium]|nr:HPr kinase/phosphatase C-terminal domain-containing protein [Geminicoccaceae bacterium]